MPGTEKIVKDAALRLSNQLMIGHGAALLLIFNKASDHPEARTDAIQFVAWIFAIGLLAAFFTAFASFVHDTGDAALMPSEKIEPANFKMLDWWMARIGYAFAVSAACFVVGIMLAIGQLA